MISDTNSESAVFANDPSDVRHVLDAVCNKVMSTAIVEVPGDD